MLLKEMIVTDADGKIENAKGEKLTGKCIQSEDMYSFYAIKQVNPPKSKPTSEQKAAKVKIMMPLGGELNGMYRFPRVGEKVVVAVEGAAHLARRHARPLVRKLDVDHASFTGESDAHRAKRKRVLEVVAYQVPQNLHDERLVPHRRKSGDRPRKRPVFHRFRGVCPHFYGNVGPV